MAKSGKEREQARRDRKIAAGLRKHELWLTDEEWIALQCRLHAIRQARSRSRAAPE